MSGYVPCQTDGIGQLQRQMKGLRVSIGQRHQHGTNQNRMCLPISETWITLKLVQVAREHERLNRLSGETNISIQTVQMGPSAAILKMKELTRFLW
jgi:hypothetical protein